MFLSDSVADSIDEINTAVDVVLVAAVVVVVVAVATVGDVDAAVVDVAAAVVRPLSPAAPLCPSAFSSHFGSSCLPLFNRQMRGRKID